MIVFLDSLERCQVGIIRSVWRGAVHKAGSKQTRTQQATRPSPCALPLASCVAVRVLQMTEGAPGRFFVCSLSQCFLLDPVGTVLCELTYSDVQDQDDGARTVDLLPDKSLEALRAIKEKPELWKNPSKQVVKQLQDDQASGVPHLRGLELQQIFEGHGELAELPDAAARRLQGVWARDP